MPHHGRAAPARYRAATRAVLCAAVLAACGGAPPGSPAGSPAESRPPGRELVATNPAPSAPLAPVTATVARVVDGDTLLLTDGQRVRLLGVDSFSRLRVSHETSVRFAEVLMRG